MILPANLFLALLPVSLIIRRLLQVVQRERTAGMYTILPFYLATFVALIPIDTLLVARRGHPQDLRS